MSTMAGRGQVRMFVAFLAVNLLSYYLYNPVPPSLEEPWKYTVGVVGSLRLLDDLAMISDTVGFRDYIAFKQNVLTFALSLHKLFTQHDPAVNITDTEFLGVPVRFYRPQWASSSARLAGLVYIHGGGFSMMDIGAYDWYLERLARQASVVVMSIDYRLAPQNPSPAPMEDCMHAARYLALHASDWGVDPARLGVAADGGGASLAVAISLAFISLQGATPFSYMTLFYPWLQALDLNTPSMQQNERFVMPDLTRQGLASHTLSYLGLRDDLVKYMKVNAHATPTSKTHYRKFVSADLLPPELVPDDYVTVGQTEADDTAVELIESGILDPYNFPLMAENFLGLPPTFVATMGHDTLRDDGFWFVRRLQQDGITVKHYHDAKSFHGVGLFLDGLLDFQAAHRLHEQVLKFLTVFS